MNQRNKITNFKTLETEPKNLKMRKHIKSKQKH